jgi:hypothetical protein
VPRSATVVGGAGRQVQVRDIVDGMGAELDEISRTLADVIHHHLSELDDDLRAGTLQSTRSNLAMIVTMLREGAPPSSAVVPAEALGYAREFVRRGLRLELLQRAYRTAQGALSHMWLDRLRTMTDDADQLVAAMGFLNDWLFAWIDAIERQLTDVYMREREQWVRGAAAIRGAEVRALLEGARTDVAETSSRLSYDLDRHHVAFVVWSDEADGDADDVQALFGEMERLAGTVTDALSANGLLTVPQGRHLACWAGTRDDGPALRTPVIRHDADSGLRVALGTPGLGVEGFCLSHREAMLARRVAKLGERGRASSTAFADVSLDALATHDVDEARRFVERELGPLAGDSDSVRRLRATLRVFLEEGASFVRAARRLGVHENTISYRVRRAEELLGRRAGERQLELRMALRLTRLVGPAAGD